MKTERIDILLSQKQIEKRITELAKTISRSYAGKEIIMVGVLTGAVVFYGELAKQISLPVKMDFMRVSSYGSGTYSSGNIRILKDLEADIAGKEVLLVEDIVDTGLTLKTLVEMLEARQPASLKICCLLDKPSRRKTDIRPDFIGFAIEDKFVVGYGLDFDQKYRNLPYIGEVKS
jgi:hypoxanthine phosphoribosyltransferase